MRVAAREAASPADGPGPELHDVLLRTYAGTHKDQDEAQIKAELCLRSSVAPSEKQHGDNATFDLQL